VNEISGILIVDKPRGWTSFDVVKKTRNMLGGVKTGHAGTLDPNATGVLVLLIGRATKAASLHESASKKYTAEVTFGRATDTYDSEGGTTETGNPDRVNPMDLEKAINSFFGESEQVPPMYSALKVQGKKLYELARAGKTVERKPRTIRISAISADCSGFPVIVLDIECSKGTYIRSIAHELGLKAGCPAHLSALRRTASGEFDIGDAVNFLELAEKNERSEVMKHIKPIDGEL